MATTDRFALQNGDGPSGDSTGNGIEVEGLVREFKKGPRAVDGIDLRLTRRDLRLSGPQRRREVDDRAHADDALAAHRGLRAGRRTRHHPPGPRRVTRSASRSRTPRSTPAHRSRAHEAPRRPSRARRRRDQAARRRAARARRARRGRRSSGRRVLGRDEAPTRPRARARPRAAHPVPRRADHRPRRPEPRGDVGRGRTPVRPARRDRVPHHAVPRGGGLACPPGRDHRPRPDRGRGHAGVPQGRDRAPNRPGRGGQRRRRRTGRRGPRTVRRAHAGATRRGRGEAVGRYTGARRRGSRARRRGSADSELELHAPSLDDVFLQKTGRRLEGAGDDEAEEAVAPCGELAPAEA